MIHIHTLAIVIISIAVIVINKYLDMTIGKIDNIDERLKELEEEIY